MKRAKFVLHSSIRESTISRGARACAGWGTGLLALSLGGGIGSALFAPASVLAAPIESFADETFVTKQSRLWTEPTKFGEPIVLLRPGVKLRVLRYSTSGAWIRAITEGEREGWIPVRFTALSGRRGQPLVSGSSAAAEIEAAEFSSTYTGSDRSPASMPTETPSTTAGAGGPRRAATPYELSAGIGYINQLSRDSGSGLTVELALQKNISPALGAFFGFDYDFVPQSASVPEADLKVSSKAHEVAPHLGVRWAPSDFSVGFGLGYVYDRTSIVSRSISTGEIIQTDGEGASITGSSSASMMLVKINPRYALTISPHAAINVGLTYKMFIAFSSGEGELGAEPSSNVMHNLGLTVSFNQGF